MASVFKFALTLLLLGNFITPLRATAADDAETLHRQLKTILEKEGLTGIAWMSITPDSPDRIGSAGVTNALTSDPFTRDTRFHVGSVTKLVLATGILRLVTEGQIDLDAPVTDYLPDLQFDNPWTDGAPVTARHLLDHTSGLEDARFWQLFSEQPKPDTPLLDGLPAPPLKIRAQPGTRFGYSNSGYGILGILIEAVTGQRYETYLDTRLLAPLGMTRSSFEFTTQDGSGAAADLAWGHIDVSTPYAARPMYLRPAGQFTTTAGDLARLARFLLGDGTLDDGSLFIRPDLLKARGKAAGTEASARGLSAGYALGLARRDRHGVVGLCHTGSIIGFYAIFCLFPEQQKAFAYSVNTDSETAEYARLTDVMIRSLDLASATSPDPAALPTDVDNWTGFYRYSPNRFEMFEYIDMVMGLKLVQVNPERSGLTLTSLQTESRELLPAGDNLYRATDRSTLSHVFYEGEEGQRFLSEGFQTYEKTSTGFVVWHVAVLVFGLIGLLILFCSSILVLATRGIAFRNHPLFPAFCGLVAFAVPVPLFFTQSFMALGDLTAASLAVAVVTTLLPMTLAVTLVRLARQPTVRWQRLIFGGAAAFSLLWWIVMASYGQMPFMLWA